MKVKVKANFRVYEGKERTLKIYEAGKEYEVDKLFLQRNYPKLEVVAEKPVDKAETRKKKKK